MPTANPVVPSIGRTMLRLGIATIVILSVIGLGLGRNAFEKIATSLAMPCGIFWYLMLCVIALAISSGQKRIAFLTIFICTIFTVSGSGLFSQWLAATIESPFLQIDPQELAPLDFVIVLGGGASQGANERFQGNGSGDRLILAAQLYHAGTAKHIICTGKRIKELTTSANDPADLSTDILRRLNVPDHVIEQVGGRTTSEEMKTLGERFANSEARVGVLTSAWHLRRAMKLAKRNGLDATPIPADLMSSPPLEKTIGEWILNVIPHADNITAVSRIFKEYLGMLVGR